MKCESGKTQTAIEGFGGFKKMLATKSASGRNLICSLLMGGVAAIATSAALANSQQSTPVDQGYEDPLQLVISLDEQNLEFYRGADLIHQAPISSGKRGHTTPRGIFSILEKRRKHFSNLYNNAPMPFMQRLTWSGIALHQGRLPGYPASHGCIRMTRKTSSTLFGATNRGMHVVVTREKQRPTPFAHANLPEPQQIIAAREERLKAEQDLKTAPLRTASLTSSGVDPVLANAVLRIEKDHEAAKLASLQSSEPGVLAPKSEKPVRVLISSQTN